MAVTAKFVADFTSFDAAVKQATVELDGFEKGAANAERQLKTLTGAYAGEKTIRDATLVAEAIERVGGESKLTAAELTKAGNLAKEAAEKMRLMGVDVPERLQKLSQHAKDSSSSFLSLDGVLGKVGATMAATFTVGAAVNAIQNTGEWAGKIDDLSKKLSVSRDAVQRLSYAAELNGASIDGVSTAIAQMSKHLVNGDDSAVEGLSRLNLSIDDLRKKSPDEAFTTIASAIAALPNPMEQSATAMALLGRSGADLLPMFGSLAGDMNAAVVASDDVIAAGDSLGDSWSSLKTTGEALLAGVLVPLAPAFDTAAKAAKRFAQEQLDLAEATRRADAALDKQRKGASSSQPPSLDSFFEALARGGSGDTGFDPERGAEIERQKQQLVTDRMLNQAKLGRNLSLPIAPGLSTVNIDKLAAAIDKDTQALAKLEKQSNETKAASLKTFEGAIKAADDYREQLDIVEKSGKHLSDTQKTEINKALQEGVKAYEALGRMAPKSLTDAERATRPLLTATTGLGKQWDLAASSYVPTLAGQLEQLDPRLESVASDTDRLRMLMHALPAEIRSAGDEASTFGDRLKEGFGEGFQKSIENVPSIISSALINGADWEQTGAAIASSVGAGVGGAIGKSLTHGSKVGEAIGEAAGSMFGLVADALHHSAGEDVMERVGRDWGIRITEGMGDEIAKDAKNLFRGDRQAAEIFNLGKLINLDGLDTDNIDRLTGKLHDVFSMLETGMFTSAQATRVLNESFGQFADFFDGGLISDDLREIVDLIRQTGTESKAVTDFLQKQASDVQTGFGGIVGGAVGDVAEKIRTLKELQAGKDPNQDEVAKLQSEIGAGAIDQESFDRLGRLAQAAFGASLQAGVPFLDALDQMDTSLSDLSAVADQFGLTQSAAFGNLSAIDTFFDKNEALGDSITGTQQMLQGLYNSGLLTQETFDDLGHVAVDNFNAMTAGGLTADQALLAQQQTLQTLWELQQKGTYAVDENTQALIDQAAAQGLVGEDMKEVNEQILDVLKAIGKVLGADLPDGLQRFKRAADDANWQAIDGTGELSSQVTQLTEVDLPGSIEPWREFGNEGVSAANDITNAIKNIPTSIDITVNRRTVDVGGGPSDGGNQAAGGFYRVSGPTQFTAGEAGPEDVLFSGANRRLNLGGGGGGSTPSNEDVVTELRGLRDAHDGLRADVRRLFDSLPRQIAAAGQLARGRGASFVS